MNGLRSQLWLMISLNWPNRSSLLVHSYWEMGMNNQLVLVTTTSLGDGLLHGRLCNHQQLTITVTYGDTETRGALVMFGSGQGAI